MNQKNKYLSVKHLSWVVALAILTGTLAGCSKLSSSTGGVAVIDLDRVAKAMGWLDDLSKNLQAADTELRTQLEQVQRGSRKAIDDAKAEVVAAAKLTPDQVKLLDSIQDNRDLAQLPLTKEQREKLINTVAAANTRWQSALNAYQQQIQQSRGNLILAYREQVRPFARRVALARGLNVVLIAGDNVLLAETAADISNDVIDELQKGGVQKVAPLSSVTTEQPKK